MPTPNQIREYLAKTGKVIEVQGPIGALEFVKMVGQYGADKVRVV